MISAIVIEYDSCNVSVPSRFVDLAFCIDVTCGIPKLAFPNARSAHAAVSKKRRKGLMRGKRSSPSVSCSCVDTSAKRQRYVTKRHTYSAVSLSRLVCRDELCSDIKRFHFPRVVVPKQSECCSF